MTDERMARPVSGEIMSGTADGRAATPRAQSGNVIDADFVSVSPSPRSGLCSGRDPMPGPAPHLQPAPTPGMDILKGAQAGQSRRAGPSF